MLLEIAHKTMLSPDAGAHIGRGVQRFLSKIFADTLKQLRRF
jgi:hypothetical protein